MLTAHTNASVNTAILQDYKSAYGITSKNQIIAEWNMNAYNDIKTYGVIDTDLNQRIQEGTDQIPIEIDSTTASYSFIKNYERRKYSDLGAVFEPVRPDVNILNYVHSRFRRNIVDDVSEIRVNNLNPYSVRLYPFSENFKGYSWSSIRTKLSSDKTDVTYTGISDSNGNIKDADVYVNYSSSFYINKLTFKTQYYNGFPASFSIYITNNITSSSNWTLIYSYSGASASSPLSDGQLDLYYNYSSSAWTTASSSNTLVTDLDSTSNQFTAIQGIRIKVEKMYNPNSTTNLSGQDFQLIEISPRLVADITEYTKSFSINSQIADSQFGMPVGGIISSTGNIELSNMAKYFSNNSTNSIIKNYLNPNVKFNFYQLVDKTVSGSAITARIPLKTLYALRWEENSEFSTNIELEDYTKFFKEKASPDIVIANNSGVPVSVALLQLLDNIGFNKYIFRKTSNSADIEDVILQFFYSRKENTLAQTLEELARSAQLSMYFDAENNFIVMTKEKVSKPLPKESASWWFIADPENLSVSDEEYSILNSSSYVSNIKTFEKSTNPPITDARIGYNGLGIQKEPYDLVTNPDLRELLDSQQLDAAPILSRNLRYATTNLWSSNNDNKNILLSGTLMENIPGSVLSEMKNLSASPVTVQASNEYDAIRQYYFSKNAASQKYLKIVLDPTSMETFVANQSYNGTLLIDDEYISFKGILFDHHSYQGTATSSIIFNERERQGLRSSLPSGSTLSPKALILYLDFDIKNQTSSVIFDASGSLTYQLNYHGRGVTTYQTSEISEHYGVISASSLSNWTPFTTRIMTANEYKPSGTPTYTIVSDPSLVNKSLSDSSLKSYPGYLRLSGLKFDNTTASGIFGSTSSSAAFLGIKFNYKVDTDISGIAYSSSVKFNLIATRMRILQYTKPPQKIVDVNRDVQDLSGIGGIFFGLKNEGTASTTGYFVELASAGQTNDAQLESNDLENLRLYKISYSTSASRTEVSLLGKAAVAVASTAQATKDVKAVTEEGSFTAISDLRVLIEDNSIEVYWEDQKVITYRNSGIKNEIFKNATKSGLFVRGNTVALFEYFLASPSNIAPYSDTFDKGLSISDAERGILTRTVKEVKSKKLVNVFYEDFGKVVKEIKKINVRFEPPAVKAQVLDFGIKNSKYYIPNFSSTSFGANFWILNTSNDIIKIGEDSSVPIYIAGFALTKSNADNSYVEMQDFIDAQQNKFNIDEADNEFSKITSNIEKNKLYYGENTLTIDTEYIFTYQQAYELLSWLVKNYTKERITVNMEIYANPLLELGDIVRVFYREKGFTQNKIGDKSFIITGIEHSVSSNGPTMNVEIRECF